MKKIIKILAVIFMLGSMTLNAKANMIGYPHNNDFFIDHQDEMENGTKYCYEAKVDVAVVDYPNSNNIIGVIEKGRVLWLDYMYKDEKGTYWGMQVLNDEDCAWFSLKNMSEAYTNVQFWMEHQEEFKKTYYEQIYFEEEAWLVVWDYPGSDRITGALPTSVTRDKKYPLYEGAEYTDKNGVRWTSIQHMGAEGWLNMESVLSDTKPEVAASVRWSIDENFNPADYPDLGKSFVELYAKEILIGGVVIGVCVLTGILALRRKK